MTFGWQQPAENKAIGLTLDVVLFPPLSAGGFFYGEVKKVVDFTYESLAEDVGTNGADGLRNLANTAANVYCDAYSAYAGAFNPGSSPIGLVRGIDAFNSRLCSPRNRRPPLPTSPFTGGQCPLNYIVNLTIRQPNLPDQTVNYPNAVPGPISGIVIGTNSNGQRVWSIQGNPSLTTPPGGRFGVLVEGTGFPPNSFNVRINSVTPQSGSDTCGNPPPQYPPVVAPAPSLNVPVNVNLGGFNLNATAIIIPTKFEANLEVNAGVEVQIGDFNIQFDAGGVTINNTFKPTLEINLPGSGTDGRPNPPQPKPIKRNDEGCDLEPVTTDLSEIKELLEDIKECACDDTEERVISFGVANSGIYSSPNLDIVEIRLNLIDVPSTIRMQSGGANAPDVYYAGWYAFGTSAGSFGDREPVSYLQNAYIAPEGARAFSYTLQTGCTGTVTMVYKAPKQP